MESVKNIETVAFFRKAFFVGTLIFGVLFYSSLLAVEYIFADKSDAQGILPLLQDHRLLNSVKELKRDARLACAAEAHAYEMYQRSSCVTVGRLGEGAAARARECGFPYMGGEFFVVCDPISIWEHWFTLRSKAGGKLLEYRYVGTGKYLNYHVLFLAN